MINKPDHSGLTHIFNAMIYSWQGLKAAFTYEEAFRLELLTLPILLPAAFWLGEGGIEQALLIGVLFIVLIVELVNSAIEAVVDRIGTEQHPLSGRAKDIGSAAVFLSMMLVIATWLLILGPRYLWG